MTFSLKIYEVEADMESNSTQVAVMYTLKIKTSY